jgi:hypothetical protein
MFNFLLKGSNDRKLQELIELEEDQTSMAKMINKCIEEYYNMQKDGE